MGCVSAQALNESEEFLRAFVNNNCKSCGRQNLANEGECLLVDADQVLNDNKEETVTIYSERNDIENKKQTKRISRSGSTRSFIIEKVIQKEKGQIIRIDNSKMMKSILRKMEKAKQSN